ncbi:MAG TPA: ABC transporter substrate-binding protein [Candidatus Acidoferrales bacterium]|nr:ABC transporter substrate-binding protein [Candidatus Acidoferrales bacterium]
MRLSLFSSRLGVFTVAAIVAGLSAALASNGALAAGTAVKIGVIADVSGSAAAYGMSQKNAYALATEDLKTGKLDAGTASVTFDVEDSASDPAQVVTLTQAFTNNGAALLVGPTLSAEAKKADPIAVAAGLTILATSNTAQGITSLGPCVFRDSLAEEQVVPETVAKIAGTWKPKTAAIIYGDDNQFTKTDYEIFAKALAEHHITVVDVETYHTGDVDFRAQLTKIAGAKPDLLVVGALVDEAVKIVAQAAAAGVNAHIVGGNGLNSPKFIQLAGRSAEGVVVGAAYYAGDPSPVNAGFVQRYEHDFGIAPDQFAAQAYAAAEVIARLAHDGATSSAAFCSGLKSVHVATVLGPLSFDATHDASAPSDVMIVSKGRFTLLK